MLCTASDTFRILVYSALFFFRYMQAYSVVFSVIKAYSSILRHYYGIFRLIQAYSAPCVSLTYLQPCHILSPCIFRTRGLFKTLWNVDQPYSEPYHRALFIHIQAYSKPCATLAYERESSEYLAYSKSWNIQCPSIIASQRVFRALSYLR